MKKIRTVFCFLYLPEIFLKNLFRFWTLQTPGLKTYNLTFGCYTDITAFSAFFTAICVFFYRDNTAIFAISTAILLRF